jgi:hypothetical protein
LSALDDKLAAAIAAQADAQVVSLLRGVTDKERRASSKTIGDRVTSSWDFAGKSSALAIAALGLAQSAAQAAQVVRHVDVSKVASLACEVLAERRPRWLEDFSRRILLPGPVLNGGWRLTRALIRVGYVPKPDVPGYITFLPHALGGTFGIDPPLYQALLDDPELLEDEVLRLFTVEGAGPSLAVVDGNIENVRHYQVNPPRRPNPEWSPRTWRVTLTRLCDEGRIGRGRLLDACLGAFLSDFPPSQVSWFVRFHDEIAPQNEEIAERSATYLRLLAADASSVVGLAQHALAPLAAAGLLDGAECTEASMPVLGRTEKKHVLGQLRLLETVTAGHPELDEPACRAVALALAHPRADVAEQALRFLGRHMDRLDAAARQQIAMAARYTPASLLALAEKLLGLPGDDQPGSPEAAPGVALAGSATAHVAGLERVSGPHELAETAAALVESPWEPSLVEQLLDGLVGLCGDYDAFATALAPVAARVGRDDAPPQLRLLSWLLRPGKPAARMRDDLRRGYAVGPEPFWDNRRSIGTSPGGILGARLHETYSRFWRGEPARLLAFPAAITGHVDPDRVVTELARLEAEGRQPWPADFLQAVLRLPRRSGSPTRGAAARLRSPAGRQFALALDAGGVPDPRPAIAWAGTESMVALTPAPEAAQWGEHLTRIWELPDQSAAIDAWYQEAPQLRVWAWTLPSHRDVVVAHALPVLTGIAHPGWSRGPIAEFIAALPDMDGPAGPATNLALCYALAAERPEHRAAGAEALVGFARTGGLDGRALGETIAILCRDGSLILGRICDGLRVAADSGTHALVWAISRAALPGLLDSRARHTHRLLAVAADSAARLGARDTIKGLDAISAAPGSSQLIVEARRLRAVLTS